MTANELLLSLRFTMVVTLLVLAVYKDPLASLQHPVPVHLEPHVDQLEPFNGCTPCLDQDQ